LKVVFKFLLKGGFRKSEHVDPLFPDFDLMGFGFISGKNNLSLNAR
jgi:hypothetical protein